MVKKPDTAAQPAAGGTAAGTADAIRVSSPASTGGAGTFFEQHVNAYWLAQLLVQGIPPILHDCTVVEVHLQTERLGWHTDDFLIVGRNGSGKYCKLAGQVKRKFTVSVADDEFRKALQDFWKDFRSPQQFSGTTDRFVVVTLRGTNTLLECFAGLLDTARAARDGSEFERSLATPGFLNAKAVEYCQDVRTIVAESEGKSVSVAEVWPFLRVLHVLSLDLNSSTRQTEAMIKTLLAYTTADQDPLGVAEASWSALLREIGEGMPEARSFRRDDLPEALRRRHSPVGGPEQRTLQVLGDHSGLILDGICSTIGKELHLRRGGLVQQVIERLESSQIVMVSGPAGSGKSGIAKDVFGSFATDHFAFCFRAEEFACPHFDETLQRIQAPCSGRVLGAILAGQGRKVLLIESVERLLENSTRDAFTDLLTLAARDPSWRLILTCRDYSTDLVRTAFLRAAGIDHSEVKVPLLEDDELKEVEAAFPILGRPLGSGMLRRLLRNPYILDKALGIDWSAERPLPVSEREFRERFWQEIVRAEHYGLRGMPRRREEVFIQIAIRRAQALTPYASCDGLDEEVVDALRHDSLIITPPANGMMVAPAHDVLEDWAILQWIDGRYATLGGSVKALCLALGTYPAVRRTYRKWGSELEQRDPEAADRVFQAVVSDDGLPAQFRDDTLIAMLRSSAAGGFLERHRAHLFASDKQLLRRVIQLLRIACVATPSWLPAQARHPSLFDVPDGPAWACVLRLVECNLESFAHADRSLLLGFIEDWARGVSWQTPYPEGAESAAAIAYWLLPGFDGFRSNDHRKRTLQVIAKIPMADSVRFVALLHEGVSGDPNQSADDLREIVFDGTDGMPAARDVPEAVVSAAANYLFCSEVDLEGEWGNESGLELEPLFGIRAERSHNFFPASAYRGPFLHLLRHHPDQGLDLIVAVSNHSADWYAHPKVRDGYVEPPLEITLAFADGTYRRQWCNARLWNLYRGTSVGPCVLQSMLMALERWLLESAKAHPSELDGILLSILQRSDSAALTAVVASVATAIPAASGETLLVLLRSRESILLDRGRLVAETGAPSRISALLPKLNARNTVYEGERTEADARPHRRQDLESAILNLQFSPLAPRVHDILDRHHTDMRPVEEQGDGDRIWRLALHRMDLRQYSVAGARPEGTVVSEDPPPPSGRTQHVLLTQNEPEPDVKEMVNRSLALTQSIETRLGLEMWGRRVFRREEEKAYDPARWRERLQEARAADDNYALLGEYDLGKGGPGFVAAVCVRDHWDELSGDEREWCVNILCSEIERDAYKWNHDARVQRGDIEADRPCAWTLPLLLGKQLDEPSRSRVGKGLAIALTHAVDEVRWHAASGVGCHLWGIDRELALRCVNALAMEATSVHQAVNAERGRSFPDRRKINDIEAELASAVRERFFEPNGIPADAYAKLDQCRRFGVEANRRIMTILGRAPFEAVTIDAFQRLAATLIGWWDQDDDWHRDGGQERLERSHETESALRKLLVEFLLQTTTENAAAIVHPIVDAIDRHPDKVYWILMGLISIEDCQPNTLQFWSLWHLFADKVRRAIWLPEIDREHTSGTEMVSAMFLGTWWKEGIRHWRSLEGFAEHVHALFEDLPSSSTVLHAYVRFLHDVGAQSLPGSFVRIAQRLRGGDPRQMMREADTAFLLEVLLQRYVYGRPLELKRQVALREAVLFILDLLVETGSSAAFRMRDDFVTPASTT